VRWVRDATGRFPKRPHYDAAELDQTCAALVAEVRLIRPGQHPRLSTDDLTVLIEHRAADLDLYADLSSEGADVEAVTDFCPKQRPRVRVSRRLSEQPRLEHRLRTTLAHELAHVVLHNFIWWFDQAAPGAEQAAQLSPRCHRLGARPDWMEWQAGYASGALLIPASVVRDIAGEGSVWVRSAAGRAMVRRTQAAFGVSAQAAAVRLQQLGYLSRRPRFVPRAPVPRF
jgi:uncharacterized protein DUF955